MRLAPIALPLLSAALMAASPPSDPVNDALYKERFAQMMQAGGFFTHYSPMEAVVGATKHKPLPQVAPGKASITQDALDKAVAYARATNSSALIVWRDGVVQTSYFAEGMGPESPIVSKSLSKPLSSIAIGRAIALGKIKSLDQPVADFVPEWKDTPKATILIRHLLDMRSGLLEQMVSPDPDHPINKAYIDPYHDWHLVNNYPLTHTPGTHYGYNNATAELVAVVIERATGQRYADFIGQQILAPIGAEGGEIWLDRKGGLAHSGCCMTLPAPTWLKLGLLVLDDGKAKGKRLLPKGYVTEMRTGTAANPYYGLGLWVAGPYTQRRGFAGQGGPGPKVLHSQPYLDKNLVLFDGNSNQTVFISRATGIVALRLGPTPPKTPEWDNSYLPNVLIDGIIPRKGEKTPTPQK